MHVGQKTRRDPDSLRAAGRSPAVFSAKSRLATGGPDGRGWKGAASPESPATIPSSRL